MTPVEMARRVRHDLIKHLDIPDSGQKLDASASRVLMRRLFDSSVGLCRIGAVWGFKLRRDDGWMPELDNSLTHIEKLCAAISKREKQLQKQLLDAGVVPDEVIAELHQVVDAVHRFETVCEQVSNANVVDDEEAALSFFDFLSPKSGADVVTKTSQINAEYDKKSRDAVESRTSEMSSQNRKMRLLVVDDHLMSIDRLQMHATFKKRFSWATVCGRSCECESCECRESCENRRARNYHDVIHGLIKAREENKCVDALLMDVRFDDLDAEELVWIPELPALNKEDHVKALQGLIIARQLRRMPEFCHIPIVLMTARSRLPEGASSLLEGLEGLQFVDDDDSLEALAARVESIIRMGQDSPVEQGYFWGTSSKIQSVRRQIEIMSQGPRTVFITGPSGSGKSSLVEQIIYPLSGRRNMVTLDLSSVPDSLVESELFGHVKGAYSGAVHDRVGLIEEADGGILFLDEIGNLSLENQRKLLLFLQDKMVRRVGAAHETRRHVDVKVVVATHLDLSEEVAAGRFRFDLFMRFGPAMRIALPSLAERRDDLPDFVETLVLKIVHGEDMKPHIMEHRRRTGANGNIIVEFASKKKLNEKDLCVRFKDATRELFLGYDWPGNTRELESVLDTLILKALFDLRVSASNSRIIEIDHLYALSLLGGIERRNETGNALTRQADECGLNLHVGQVADFGELRKQLEQQYLKQIFDTCHGDLGRMGAVLFGDDSPSMQHKITMRLNQLGMSVRRMKHSDK